MFLEQGEVLPRLVAQGQVTVGEIGFGAGINFLVTLEAVLRHGPPGGQLCYVGFERRPWRPQDLRRLWQRWPTLWHWGRALLAHWPPPLAGWHRLEVVPGRVTLLLAWGEASAHLEDWHAGRGVDVWYLDGFAPRRNPSAWETVLLTRLAQRSAPAARVTTYSAASGVRRALTAAGFQVERRPGFAGKRESLRGVLTHPLPCPPARPELAPPAPETARQAWIVGAGMAGAWCAHFLARAGWRVTVWERGCAPAAGASGNLRGVLMPRPLPRHGTPDWASHLQVMAYGEARRLLEARGWRGEGVLQRMPGADPERHHAWEEGMWVAEAAASRLAGVPVPGPAWWWPRAGSLAPAAWVGRLLATPGVTLRTGVGVARMARDVAGWRLWDARGRCLGVTPVLILAQGWALRHFLPWLPLRWVRGQVAHLPAQAEAPLRRVLCAREGYLTPAHEGWHCLGASFEPGAAPVAPCRAVHERLLASAPALSAAFRRPGAPFSGRVSVRATTPDHLPLVGPVADAEAFRTAYGEALRHGRRLPTGAPPYLPGLYLLSGLGAHGLAFAPWAAAGLVAQLTGQPSPWSEGARCAVHPARFLVRALRRGRFPL